MDKLLKLQLLFRCFHKQPSASSDSDTDTQRSTFCGELAEPGF